MGKRERERDDFMKKGEIVVGVQSFQVRCWVPQYSN